jgi:hypothetical protein
MVDQLGLDDAARLLDETLQGREADWKLAGTRRSAPQSWGDFGEGQGLPPSWDLEPTPSST